MRLALLALLLLAGPAVAQDLGVQLTCRDGEVVAGDLVGLDAGRYRLLVGGRRVDVQAQDVVAVDLPALSSPPPPPAPAAVKQRLEELETLLKGGERDVVSLALALEALRDELGGPGVVRRWERWPYEDVRDDDGEGVAPVHTGALPAHPSHGALVPVVRRAARALNDGLEDPTAALGVLRLIDTPAARAALLGLFLDPRFFPSSRHDWVDELAPLLSDLDDPRVGALAILRYQQSAADDPDEAEDDLLPLIARRGGEAGVRLLLGVFERGQAEEGGRLSLSLARAFESLRWARDPRLLASALSHLRRHGLGDAFGRGLGDDDDDLLVLLIEQYGAAAVEGLRPWLHPPRREGEDEDDDDPLQDSSTRDAVVTALVRAAVPRLLSLDELMYSPEDEPELFLEVAEAVVDRADLTLEAKHREWLLGGVVLLLGSEDYHWEAVDVVGESPLFHTAEVRTHLERLARDPDRDSPEVRRALRAVRRTLHGQGGR